jgi:hypothetical protein
LFGGGEGDFRFECRRISDAFLAHKTGIWNAIILTYSPVQFLLSTAKCVYLAFLYASIDSLIRLSHCVERKQAYSSGEHIFNLSFTKTQAKDSRTL